MYIIKSGHCHIISCKNGSQAKTLGKNDVLGEGEMLKTKGYNYFGEIIAVQRVCCCMITQENF